MCGHACQVKGYQRDIAILSKELADAKFNLYAKKRRQQAKQQAMGAKQQDDLVEDEPMEIKAISLSAMHSSAIVA